MYPVVVFDPIHSISSEEGHSSLSSAIDLPYRPSGVRIASARVLWAY
jgi:hypothetical protein